MSYQEIVEKAKLLPLHEQLRLIEELARAMQRRTRDLPVPLVGTFPITDEWLNSAKNVRSPENSCAPTDDDEL